MSAEERDAMIIGFAVGALLSLWVGYWLGRRVERWHSRRAVDRELAAIRRADDKAFRRAAKHIPFDGSSAPPAQSVRTVLAKPRTIPLERRVESLTIDAKLSERDAEAMVERWREAWPAAASWKPDPLRNPGPAGLSPAEVRALTGAPDALAARDPVTTNLPRSAPGSQVRLVVHKPRTAPSTDHRSEDRELVVAALVGSGFPKAIATAAVDQCSIAERAAGVEAWTAAALRRAFTNKSTETRT